MTLVAIALAGLVWLSPDCARALEITAAKSEIDSQLDRDYPALEAIYKDIHQHPELAFHETRTAEKLASEMRALGFEVTEHVGKTGLVAIRRNGPGPTIMVRTELDALPMEEKTGLAYASRERVSWNGGETFVGHTCGHDAHMAIWVGTAKMLLALSNQWHGTLMFIGQPAEEVASGARAMLNDRLFERFGKPDVALALHIGPAPAGLVGYKAGTVTSNMDSLEISFKGVGGHGSAPNMTIDPIVEASKFVVDVQTVVSREKDPAAFGVVSVGHIHGGSAGNIIPDETKLQGTIRSYDAAVREKLIAGVQRTAKAIGEMANAPAPEVVIDRESVKAVTNDQALAGRIGPVFSAAFGGDAILVGSPTTASEDFSEFGNVGIPSFFFGLGALDPKRVKEARDGGKPLPGNHSPFFAPEPEPTIRRGVQAMTLAALTVLNAVAAK
ncbi:peptidase M20 [Bradyrhizobium brasilense]|uniref:amidohydrolase n=1 Tax=Bradyrhizobium brasilense TaxID=1419277 RepID=UPI0009779007|nr:amidohydrolase [Bradyrhizobium brasilense]OMI05831.1 peptidase M20 [Bradyrhizobium brasilense]